MEDKRLDQARPTTALVNGPERAPARSCLRATGLKDGGFGKPHIAIVNSWPTVTSCNMHLDELARAAEDGVVRPAADPSTSAQSWFQTASDGAANSQLIEECAE